MEKTVSFCGRALAASELGLVRQIIADFPRLSQAELAHTICELLEWRRPNGKLKSPECVEWLQKWQEHDCLPGLPELRVTKPRGAHRFQADSQSDPQSPVRGRLADYRPLRLQLVEDLAGRRLFQQYIQRYHPLGYRVPYGAQLRYLVRAPSQDVLACLLFTSAAWKMAARDAWIGWNDPTRRAHLPRLVNNGRFLILPWVEVPHLASHILALAARQLPTDWLAAYGVRPLLLETLVDRPYSGTCYRAANWIHVGQTQGRGRMDRTHQALGSCKDILLYPLEPHWRQRLCQLAPPQSCHDPVGEVP
ncbi:MAG: DUF4338 domain-containing protein [Acidobacteriia bacterium]|nr:DUF4338 domain-containing protein [Terriglobia bacterium]